MPQPDFLSAEARRWLTSHQGPATQATRAVRAALAGYYADLVVVDGIARWFAKQTGRTAA